jgi:hypothetical protein
LLRTAEWEHQVQLMTGRAEPGGWLAQQQQQQQQQQMWRTRARDMQQALSVDK